MILKTLRRAIESVARAAIGLVAPSKKERGIERISREKGDESSRESRVLEPVGAEPERHGAARDERSFEQKRRGGPVTGEGPSKRDGPRHTGGGMRRGRQTGDTEQADFPDLPIFDYDELSPREIAVRSDELGADELARLLDYEIANKHRRSVIDALRRRLAA